MIWISVNGKAINISLAGNLLPSNPCGCHWNQYNAKLDTKHKKKLIFITFRTDFSSIFFFFWSKNLVERGSFYFLISYDIKGSLPVVVWSFRNSVPHFQFFLNLSWQLPIGHFPEEKPFETEYTNSFKFAILNEFMTWFIDLKPTI